MKTLSLYPLQSLVRQRQVLLNPAIAAGLAILTVWLYAPTRNFGFVNWDDPWYILKNPLIQSWSLQNLKSIATESIVRNYAPLTIFSFLVEYTIWGDWAGGYHLTNVLLHTTNAVLVFFLLRQVTKRTDLAIATAVLFAVHPVHVESVAWISSRKGLLAGVFMLSSLRCWLRPNRTPKQEVWGIGFLILGLLSKAIAIVVPPIVLCYDVFVRRDRLADAFIRQMIPGFLSLWLLLTTMAAQVTMLGGLRGHFELNRFEIMAVDLVILWRYVGMLLCPQNLCVLYNPSTAEIWFPAIVAGLGWGAVGWWFWSKRERHPLALVAVVSWILLLIPVLNFFPITTLMNDRYLYLPSIPAFALLVAGVGGLLQQLAKWTTSRLAWAMGLAMMVLVSAGYIQKTQNYLPVWQSDLALWAYASQQTPDLPAVQIQRAISLQNAGQTDAAIEALDYALTHCDPDDIDRERIKEKKAAWTNPD